MFRPTESQKKEKERKETERKLTIKMTRRFRRCSNTQMNPYPDKDQRNKTK